MFCRGVLLFWRVVVAWFFSFCGHLALFVVCLFIGCVLFALIRFLYFFARCGLCVFGGLCCAFGAVGFQVLQFSYVIFFAVVVFGVCCVGFGCDVLSCGSRAGVEGVVWCGSLLLVFRVFCLFFDIFVGCGLFWFGFFAVLSVVSWGLLVGGWYGCFVLLLDFFGLRVFSGLVACGLGLRMVSVFCVLWLRFRVFVWVGWILFFLVWFFWLFFVWFIIWFLGFCSCFVLVAGLWFGAFCFVGSFVWVSWFLG